MKLMIASDIHGSDLYCAQLLDAFEREGAGRLVLLGDLLYHGPRNDYPDGYDTRGVYARLNAVKERLLCVRGNCDSEVDQMVLEFPMMAEYAVLYVGERLMLLTHGHVDRRPLLAAGDVLVSGHTHVPAWDVVDGVWCLNPGSAALPKEGSARGYMVVEDGGVAWKALSGETYHTLDLT